MKNKTNPAKQIENFLRRRLGIKYDQDYFVELIKFDPNETNEARSKEPNVVALHYERQLKVISEDLYKLCQKIFNK
jgi:hypothetical protein